MRSRPRRGRSRGRKPVRFKRGRKRSLRKRIGIRL